MVLKTAALDALPRDLACKDASHEAICVQLRAWLSHQNLPPDTRLPPERELCEILGVSRSELRKALARLEEEGQLWRHVGKGTFSGARQMGMISLVDIDRVTNPTEVMRTRLLIEPILAREAALHATKADLDALRSCLARSQTALSWRQYELSDNELHRLIAVATGNTLLLGLFDALNAVRRAVAWGMLRGGEQRPPNDHHSFIEHEIIINAIAARDCEGAGEAMRQHIAAVKTKLLDGAAVKPRRTGMDQPIRSDM